MKSLYKISWQDLGKSLIVAFLTVFVSTLAQSFDPTGMHLPKISEIILALKAGLGGMIAYLIKNFFTDDLKQALKVVEKSNVDSTKLPQ